MKQTLLLSSNFEVLDFIGERKVIKFLYNEKCDVISTWNEVLNWGNKIINYPSILRLKNPITKKFIGLVFSRQAIVNRDQRICQYCNKKLTPSQITIDHVIPKAQGGDNSFTNCVVSCHSCNNKKGNNTPEQVGMKLIRKPSFPTIQNNVTIPQESHQDWLIYLK